MSILQAKSKIGPYTIQRRIGAGGMGEVYEAFEEDLSRKVALKFLNRSYAKNKEMVKRFEAEGRTLAKIHHTNTVTIYRVGKHDGIPYIAMEFVNGLSLSQLMKSQSIELDKSLSMFIQLLNGVHALHKHGIIHRDLKPANIIYQANERIKIVDFGIAKTLDEDENSLTKLGTVIGSVKYMAPEVAAGKNASGLSDIRSLGIIFYELLTGSYPFKTIDNQLQMLDIIKHKKVSFPREFKNKIPQEVMQLVLKMCAISENDRYQSVKTIQKDLYKIIEKYPFHKKKISQSEDLHFSDSLSFETNFLTEPGDTTIQSDSSPGPPKISERPFQQKSQTNPLYEYSKPPSTSTASLPSNSDNVSIYKEKNNFLKYLTYGSLFVGLLFAVMHLKKWISEGTVEESSLTNEPVLALTATDLIYPLNDSHLQRDTFLKSSQKIPISFLWTETPSAVKYRFEVSKNKSFSPLLKAESTQSIRIDHIKLKSGDYFWRVKSISKDDSESEWSPVWAFRLANLKLKKTLEPLKPSKPLIHLKPKKLPQVTQTRPIKPPKKSPPKKRPSKKSKLIKKVKSSPKLSPFYKLSPKPLTKTHTFYLKMKKGYPSRQMASVSKTILNPPLLKWSPLPTAQSYNVEFSKQSNFSESLNHNVSNAQFLWRSPRLGKWYWRVQGVNKKGAVSGFSKTVKIITLLPPPLFSFPTKTKKVNSFSDLKQPHTTIIKWLPNSLVPLHHLILASDPGFKTVIQNIKTSKNSATVPLDPNQSYYVKLAALDSENHPISLFSKAKKFDFKVDFVPVTPKVFSPSSNYKYSIALKEKKPLFFKWKEISELSNYQIQISFDRRFKKLLVNKKLLLSEFHLKDDIRRGRFYWRIRGIQKGYVSQWSPTMIVHITY